MSITTVFLIEIEVNSMGTTREQLSRLISSYHYTLQNISKATSNLSLSWTMLP